MRGFIGLLRRFHSDERGVFAVIFGIMAIVLIATAGAVVDFTSEELARTKAQQALDAAVLGLAPTIYDDDADEDALKLQAQNLVVERLGNASIAVNIDDAEIDTGNGTLTFSGSITVPMAFLQLVGIQNLTARITSEATKGSINLEVALALDTTLSMKDSKSNKKISALEEAASDLIDLVVKDNQSGTYTRMAVVPYSMGVNAGTYANAVRGTPIGSKAITAASWYTISKTITGVTNTKNSDIVVTASGTSSTSKFADNDRVYMVGLSLSSINKTILCVSSASTPTSGGVQTFKLKTISGGACATSALQSTKTETVTLSSAKAYTCTVSSCKVKVTSASHGIANSEYVYITDVKGMTQLNTKAWPVESADTNSFVINDSTAIAPTSWGTYSSGGNTWCLKNVATASPCTYFRYTAADNSTVVIKQISNCTTERATLTYTNDPPTSAWLGRHYPNNSLNACPSNNIVPLTDVKKTLHDATDDLVVAGSTSGHIGLAWAWYMLSPDWGYLWDNTKTTATNKLYTPADPDAEDAEKVAKVLVLMTDGLFNTAYCNGVVSKDSDNVAGTNAERINCNAPDDSSAQGAELCDKIKDDGIEIYTVAFALDEIKDTTERATVTKMLADCASDSSHAYTAANADDLSDAFNDIGRNITNLRLSK